MTPEQAAQAQLDAYNARDLEAFLRPYHPDVELARLRLVPAAAARWTAARHSTG